MSNNVAILAIAPSLIADLKRGGNVARAAVANVFAVLQPRARHYLLRHGADSATADDLCQDLFVRIMERIHDYRGEARFEAWAFAILRRLWIDRIRARANHVSLPEEGEEMNDSATQFVCADDAAQSLAARRAISALEAFATAEPAAAELIELRIFEEWDYAALAVYYGTSEGAVRERVSAARKKLEKYLGPLIDFIQEGNA